ncbi:phosphotransferase enzyme family protein [Lentibacillus halophilus]|uniref:Phosphotransferase enzyme family protein n=1 Tax=Lentibacillus halophilus TaxID=295065 RepID=A0ABN0Z995_9BACI
MQVKVKHALIDTQTINQMVTEHHLRSIADCHLLARGLNDTYYLEDEQGYRYIFRLYRSRWRDKQAILFELEAINLLYRQGFRASHPVKKRNGDYLYEAEAPEGLRYGVLFSYSEGERPPINMETSELIGATLGRMHQLTTGFTSTYERGFELGINDLLDNPADIISPVIDNYLGHGAVDLLHTVVKNTKADLADLDLERDFCHGDFHNHNMHLSSDGMELFDFDDCAIGFRGYDIAVSWWNLLNNYKNMENECWDAFLKGYTANRDLADDDFRSIPRFITARRIWLMGTMLANDDVWGTNWINERTLKLFMGQLRTDRPGDKDLQELDDEGII